MLWPSGNVRGAFRAHDPLAFPVGRSPGFDATHPVAQNVMLSAVVLPNGNVLRLDRNALATVSGSPAPTFPIDGVIGPSISCGTTNTGGTSGAFFTITTASAVSVTMAAIIRMPSAIAGGTAMTPFAAASVGATSNAFIITTASGLLSINQGGTLASTLINLAVNVPYFIAASWASSGTIDFVIVNLANGQTNSGTLTGGVATTAGTKLSLGNTGISTPNRNFQGRVSAVVYSQIRVSKFQLLSWVFNDLYGFWYPPPQPLPDMSLTMVGASADDGGSGMVIFRPRFSQQLPRF